MCLGLCLFWPTNSISYKKFGRFLPLRVGPNAQKQATAGLFMKSSTPRDFQTTPLYAVLSSYLRLDNSNL